MPEQIIFTMD